MFFPGDFRQILPVVPRGNAAAVLEACIADFNGGMALRSFNRVWMNKQVRRGAHDVAAGLAFSHFLLVGDNHES